MSYLFDRICVDSGPPYFESAPCLACCFWVSESRSFGWSSRRIRPGKSWRAGGDSAPGFTAGTANRSGTGSPSAFTWSARCGRRCLPLWYFAVQADLPFPRDGPGKPLPGEWPLGKKVAHQHLTGPCRRIAVSSARRICTSTKCGEVQPIHSAGEAVQRVLLKPWQGKCFKSPSPASRVNKRRVWRKPTAFPGVWSNAPQVQPLVPRGCVTKIGLLTATA